MVDKARRYTNSNDFFTFGGSVSMRLTSMAAKEVCLKAADHGLVVARIEGGIWHNPGFGSRLDCIWDGMSPPLNSEEARQNNICAAEFIVSEEANHDVFIVTAPPIEGRAES